MRQVERLFKQEVNDNQRANALEQERNHLHHLLSRDPFVVILIDGSHLIFSEELLKGGEQGGLQAAQSLKEQVTQWIPSHIGHHLTEFKVTAKVYADFKELAGLYEPWQYQDFFRGFNTLLDFIDIGNGTTDGKIHGECEQSSHWRRFCQLTFLVLRKREAVSPQLPLHPVARRWRRQPLERLPWRRRGQEPHYTA